MDPMEQIKATFFLECEELLADLEAGLLALEAGEGDAETINAVFRAVHSVKGGAGAFGLEALVRFAHVFETTLDAMRSGRTAASPEDIKVMLRAADVLSDLVAAAKTADVAQEARIAVRAEELAGLLSMIECGEGAADLAPHAPAPAPIATATVATDDIDGLDFTPVQFAFDEPQEELPAERSWIVRFRPTRALYEKANDCVPLLRELARLGECQVDLDDSGLAPLEALEPEEAYLAWTITLTTSVDRSAIEEVFEFVDGDCELSIDAADAGEAEAQPAEVDVMALIRAASEAAPEIVALAAAAPAIPSAAAAPPFEAAPAEGGGPAAAAVAAPTIRVDLERVDRLINLVGELVINQAMLAQRVTEEGLARSSTVAVGLEELEQLTREIQDSVMAIRAQPVKSVFQRMPRLVREVASMTGKQARLVTEGEATEVDKTVIERLTDPITHMIRNAIDHGLEDPATRMEAGKPPQGTVKLTAQHRSGRIVIEVSDDGKGINRARVRDIAVNKGLIDPAALLSDEEIDNLIFMPGFSTAETISDVSGRGVGMDVVKRSIQALGGRISIVSRPGEGSTFTLSLPLTLAVLDGMVVSAGDQTLVAPLTSVIETLQPKPEQVRNLGASGLVLAVRDTFVPLIDVAEALGFRSRMDDATSGVALLVESGVGGRAALLVDDIQGQRQVVIKSLEANYQQVDGVAAATILGDGRVALILDIESVIALTRKAPRAEPLPLKAAS
jgi:two-component system chemotaxis sensor kinase CheA